MKIPYQKYIAILCTALYTGSTYAALVPTNRFDTSKMEIVTLAQYRMEHTLEKPTRITPRQEEELKRIVQKNQPSFKKDAQLFGFRQQTYLKSGQLNPMCLPEVINLVAIFLGISPTKSVKLSGEFNKKNTDWFKSPSILVASTATDIGWGTVSFFNRKTGKKIKEISSDELQCLGGIGPQITFAYKLAPKERPRMKDTYNTTVTVQDIMGIDSQHEFPNQEPGTLRPLDVDGQYILYEETAQNPDDTTMVNVVSLYNIKEAVKRSQPIVGCDPIWKVLKPQDKRDLRKILGSRFIPSPEITSPKPETGSNKRKKRASR